jgi:hypothetical protein
MTAKKAKFHAVHEINIGLEKGGVKTFKSGAPIDIDIAEKEAEGLLARKAIESAEDFNARADREAERAARRQEADAANRGEGTPDQRKFTGREVPGMTKKEESASAKLAGSTGGAGSGAAG